MSSRRVAIGLRARLCYLSVVVVAAAASALGWLIDRETGATIRTTTLGLLDRAQPVVAASVVTLMDRGADAALRDVLEDVVDADPFELAACFERDGTVRATASRLLLTEEQRRALRAYGRDNSIGALQRAWRPAGLRFFQHPIVAATEDGGDGMPRGVLLLATDPDAVERRIATISRFLWSAASLGGGIAMIAVLLLARALTQPLLALVSDVRRLEQGLPNVRLATHRRDEVGGLARAFGQMGEAVLAARRALKKEGEQLAQKVTQRRQTLGRALRELKALAPRKDAFLSSISHEFRTPLTVMKSSAEILVEDPSSATLAQFLPELREHSQALDRLVDNLLCTVDLERGERVAMPERTTLGAIVDAALAEVESERARAGVEIEREIDDELPVRWDIALLVRVVRELALNAVRFSPRGGTVRVSASEERGRLRLVVLDEGPGIPVDRCEEIFERFHQLGDVMTDKPRGTGLGLPICRAIAILHGGWIRAEPRREPGASIVLELPLDAATGARAEETPAWVLGELRP